MKRERFEELFTDNPDHFIRGLMALDLDVRKEQRKAVRRRVLAIRFAVVLAMLALIGGVLLFAVRSSRDGEAVGGDDD